MRNRDRCSSLARIPSPHHQLIFGEVFDELIDVPSSILFRIFDRFAKLPVRQSFPNHRHARRRQVPTRRPRRKMCRAEVVILMAGAAFYRRHTEPHWPTPYVHGVPMRVISLSRIVTLGMTIHAARMPQYRNESREQRSIVARRSRGRIRRARCGYRMPKPNRSGHTAQQHTPKNQVQMLHTASDIRMGNFRIRFPVTANTAFAIAGAAQGTPGSPMPPDFSWLSTMWV